MERIYGDLTELVGGTPLLSLARLIAARGVGAEVVAKLECMNPGGSAKDRPALGMVLDAEERGLLAPGGTIIEPTSGNTGMALAWIARVRGYRTVIVMPDGMSLERRALLRALGAELVLTDSRLGIRGAMEEAGRIRDATPGAVIVGQFTNPANPASHFRTTGEEIWRDTGGRLDAFVATVGTGGTLSGAARALKAHDPGIHVVAVEPRGSAVISGGRPGPHVLEGMGAGFVPGTYDGAVVDEVIAVGDTDAILTAREVARREGLLCGFSGGAAAWAALSLASRREFAGKRIVAVLPDTGERYLSTSLFDSGGFPP